MYLPLYQVSLISFTLFKLLRRHIGAGVGMEAGRYPVAFLHVTVPTRLVDINVDPNKTKVFLQNKVRIKSPWHVSTKWGVGSFRLN